MDEQSVRRQLIEARDRLKEVEEEREILVSLVVGFEGWLRLHTKDSKAPIQLPIPAQGKTAMKGTISIRAAIRQVLADAQGAPLHAKEITRRIYSLGAVTTGKSPESIVDLTLISMSKTQPYERVAPRTWRYKGA